MSETRSELEAAMVLFLQELTDAAAQLTLGDGGSRLGPASREARVAVDAIISTTRGACVVIVPTSFRAGAVEDIAIMIEKAGRFGEVKNFVAEQGRFHGQTAFFFEIERVRDYDSADGWPVTLIVTTPVADRILYAGD